MYRGDALHQQGIKFAPSLAPMCPYLRQSDCIEVCYTANTNSWTKQNQSNTPMTSWVVGARHIVKGNLLTAQLRVVTEQLSTDRNIAAVPPETTAEDIQQFFCWCNVVHCSVHSKNRPCPWLFASRINGMSSVVRYLLLWHYAIKDTLRPSAESAAALDYPSSCLRYEPSNTKYQDTHEDEHRSAVPDGNISLGFCTMMSPDFTSTQLLCTCTCNTPGKCSLTFYSRSISID